MKKTVDLPEIRSWDEVPAFANEDEEAEFWETHGLGEELLNEAPAEEPDWLPAPGTPMGVTYSFSAHIAERLRALAKKRGVDYLALLQQFVCERLEEEERREGIIGP